MEKNYLIDCISVEGTVSMVFDDHASFAFWAENATMKDGRVIKLTRRQNLFFSSPPIVDNEPIYIGDKVRIDRRDDGYIFPENLTRKKYLPLIDVLRSCDKQKLISPNSEIVLFAAVNNVFVGSHENIWLRLKVTDTFGSGIEAIKQDLRGLFSIRFTNGLFSELPDTAMNTIKLALREIFAGDRIRIELGDFKISELGNLLCNRVRFSTKTLGRQYQPLPAKNLEFLDITELWLKA